MCNYFHLLTFYEHKFLMNKSSIRSILQTLLNVITETRSLTCSSKYAVLLQIKSVTLCFYLHVVQQADIDISINHLEVAHSPRVISFNNI